MERINNLDDLFLLVQVIEAGGFSAAAARLGTTRSLLSRRIIALEERLGARLLHRNARQFAVTATGERVYRHAAAMCESALAAEQAAAAQSVANSLVRIEAHGLLSPLVAELVPGFAAIHPRIRVQVGNGDSDFEALLRQQADVIFSLRETMPDSDDIVARSLGSVRMVTVGSPDLVRRIGTPENPSHLDEAHCLSYAGETSGYWRFRGMAPRRRNGRMASGDPGALLSAARAGVGFAQFPLYMVADDLGNGRLRRVLEPFEPSPLPLHALTLSGRIASDVTLNFVRFVQKSLAAMSERWEQLAPGTA
ncbi:LysR substrate-binding domain-containing protein [Luteibacter yeojuensis]|uniref:LysR family transcriptional regulator n=1 Tax=Luteibacter yeojuensis TaxID=345309 RepID=A0A7X5QST8_9GAMM|nr:LysR substrate-binding domain-containing protein [Luteibacter yeojuensis]NID14768.1 LysR family transcriptional regulator [Luteibacter yeojuensis]